MKKVSWVLLLIPLLLAACQGGAPLSEEPKPITQIESHEEFQKGYSQYTDGIFGFYVSFPTAWSGATSKYWEATEQYNSSPDSDICIFIDGNEENYIRIYAQHGQIVIPDKDIYKAAEFYTDSGLYGILYQREINSKKECHLTFSENKHLCATVYMDLDVFNENKEKITAVLKSIKQLKQLKAV